MAKTPDDLRSLARTHSEAALLTLVAVMNHEDATPAARISAANSILERAWGKPTQPSDTAEDDERPLSELSTPEMIEAGVEAIWSRLGGYDLGGHFSASRLAEEVYRAMTLVRQGPDGAARRAQCRWRSA
jgi:hypothetical protein